MTFRVLAFHTEGPPHDRGLNLREEARSFHSLVEPFADEVVVYSPRTLTAEGLEAQDSWADYTDYLRRHPRRRELGRFKADWARCGFNAWKPYICRKMLRRDDVYDGDVVFYHDINLTYYPAYAEHVDQWRYLATGLLDALSCDLFVPAGVKLKYDAKAHLVRRLLGKGRSLKNIVGLWNGIVIIRKSRQSMELIDEWWRLCSDLDNLSPLPNPRPYAEMIWHSIDQSVLGVASAAWRRKGLLPATWPNYCFPGRVFSVESLRCVRQKLTLGEAVGNTRIRSGMTASVLAERIGIPIQRLHQIESGHSFVETEELAALTRALGHPSIFEDLAQCDRERLRVIGHAARAAIRHGSVTASAKHAGQTAGCSRK